MRDTVFQEFINISFKTIRMLILKNGLVLLSCKDRHIFRDIKIFPASFGRATPSKYEGTRGRRDEGARTYLSDHKKGVTDRREVILLRSMVISHLRPHALPLSLIYACLTTPGPNAA